MKKYIFITLIMLQWLVSCKRNEAVTTQILDEIPEGEYVNAYCQDSIFSPEAFNLWDWAIIGDSLVVCRTSDRNDFIRIFDFPEMKLLHKFGQRGNAENDFITQNWGKTNDGTFCLYDIMKSKLYTFHPSRAKVEKQETFNLCRDEDGLCPPYTRILKIDGRKYLMKEDRSDQTNLLLTDIQADKIIDKYHCPIRPDNGQYSYARFDYSFDIANNIVLLAYHFIDRIEILDFSQGKLKVIYVMGANPEASEVERIDTDQTVFVDVCSDGEYFYCLKGGPNDGPGREILLIDSKDLSVKTILLDHDVDNITVSQNKEIVGYRENDSGCIFYIFTLSTIPKHE